MYKTLLFVLSIGFFFLGCATAIPEVSQNTVKTVTNKKIFEEEDTLIMFALRTEELGDFKSASEFFDTLYTRSNRREYLYRSLQIYLYRKENDIVIQRVNHVTQGKLDDFTLVRLKVIALIQLGKYDEAKNLYSLADEISSKPVQELNIALNRIDDVIVKRDEANGQINAQ